MNKCKFDYAWRGNCNKPTDGEYCDDHLKDKCEKCGEQIIGQCDYTGMLVCGYPVCKNECHKHKTYE